MRNSLKLVLASVACIGLVGLAHAGEASTAGHHHADQASDNKKKDQAAMDEMHALHATMSECMKMHSDRNMCDQQMMESCQKKMGKDECVKMMKHAKALEKSKAKEEKRGVEYKNQYQN